MELKLKTLIKMSKVISWFVINVSIFLFVFHIQMRLLNLIEYLGNKTVHILIHMNFCFYFSTEISY